MDKKRRSINVVYQGELAISRLGEEAYEACIGFFRRMEEDLVPGLEVGEEGPGEARRYSYRELGNFPECFLRDQLGQAVSEDDEVSGRWHSQAEEVVGPWHVKDATAWFRKFKALKDAHAAVHGFDAWRNLLRFLVADAGRPTLDWDMKFGKHFTWDATETEVHRLMGPGTPSRTFIAAFKHGTNRPCTDRSQAHKNAEDEEREWYKEFTADFKEGEDFFPAAMGKGDFMVNPEEGKAGGAPRRSADQAVWALYQRVLLHHHRFCIGEEGATAVADDDRGAAFFQCSIQLVKRPAPHPENAILLGQGDGLQLVTHEEGKVLAPFLKAAKVYHSHHFAGIPTIRDISAFVHNSVVHIIAVWMEAARNASVASARQVRCTLVHHVGAPSAQGTRSTTNKPCMKNWWPHHPRPAYLNQGPLWPLTRARPRTRHATTTDTLLTQRASPPSGD